MLKLIDLTFYTHHEFDIPQQVLEKHSLVIRYAELLKDKLQVTVVKHANFEGRHKEDGIAYHFFKGLNKFWYLPLNAIRFIAQQKPDMIMLQGLGFPLQTIWLRIFCGSGVKILIQHHGELPFSGMKLSFQRLAAKVINGYIFTAKGNAQSWMEAGVIKPGQKIYEVLEASTDLKALDKQQCRAALNIHANNLVFLWVGRLNENKNPLGTLAAFRKYLRTQPDALFYMIYSEDDQLADVKALLRANDELYRAVKLVGLVPHDELAKWYSAADYYISGSYKEGSGYALLEAMACGCVPVVTNIPSFEKITEKGKFGYLYPVGDVEALYKTLCTITQNPAIARETVIKHFETALSFQNIADDIYKACLDVSNKQTTPA